MALTLAQLLSPLDNDGWKARLLGSLQGLGLVVASNPDNQGEVASGTGSLSISGAPTVEVEVVIEVTTTGELGAAEFQYSTDAGVTFDGPETVPANGVFVLPDTGVTLTFAAGAATDSFVDGDLYSFDIAEPNFPTSNWDTFSLPRTLFETDAQAFSKLDQEVISAIASGGFIRLAKGAWQDLVGQQVYNQARIQAIATKGLATLTCAATAGPYTIAAGQLTISNTAGLRFTNTTGGTLSAGGTLQLTWEAERAGSAYNVGNGTLTIMVSSLAGVTVANPDPGGGSWVTTQGRNKETDTAYAARCIAKWPALGPGAVASTYDLWARTAAPSVTRTRVVVSAATPGQVDVYLAGESGTATGGDVDDVQEYLEARVPLTSIPNAVAADELEVEVVGTVFYTGVEATVIAAVEAALQTLIDSVSIGAPAATPTVIYLSDLIAAVDNAAGVRNFVMTGPAADVTVPLGDVATFAENLTYTGV